MNPFAAIVVKTVGAGTAATLLSLGVAGVLAQAASPSPNPSPTTSAPTSKTDRHPDRRAVARAIFESEADVLGITPQTLRADLRGGKTVAGLAKDKGMTKDQFAIKLVASVKPRLQQLVELKEITQAQADRVVDRISHGHIPFWNGIHRKPAATTPTK
jgi:hypothetical protein